ncbi:MAG: hypothetical protein SOR57_07580 [Parabacteroides sp.]|nr:hypothetical protein [Parabacteroides sp.]
MKDIIITAKRQKCEIITFIICFAIAFIMNVASIIAYNTEWSEVWTQIIWVTVLACVIYGLSVFIRILFWLVKRILRKQN